MSSVLAENSNNNIEKRQNQPTCKVSRLPSNEYGPERNSTGGNKIMFQEMIMAD